MPSHMPNFRRPQASMSSAALLLMLWCQAPAAGEWATAQPSSSPSTAKTLDFGKCPKDLPGETKGRDCATTRVPLDWQAPQGSKIELMVVRYRKTGGSGNQLWLLDGGPGGTGASFMNAQAIERYQQFGFDLYIPQHRGTGHSTPFECDPMLGIAACGASALAQFPTGLQAFNSHQAGEDLGHLIQRAGDGANQVFVRGTSYGSYWAQRYLQSFPHQANGVVLDGLLPLGAPVWDIDPLADQAGRPIFTACQTDADCARAYGWRDPYGVTQQTLRLADDAGHRCLQAAGPDRITIERWLNFLIAGNMSQAIPGLVLRMDRCDAIDQTELLAFGEFVAGMSSSLPDPQYFNFGLAWHVMRTDLMASIVEFPLGEKIIAREPLVIWSGAAYAEDLAAMTEQWPVNYPPLGNVLAKPKTKMLVMTGGLDMATPSVWATDFAARHKATLARFPYASHVVDDSLSMPFATGDIDCSLRIQKSFYKNPNRIIDTSCTLAPQTLDVAGHTSNSDLLAQQIYSANTPLLGHQEARQEAHQKAHHERVTKAPRSRENRRSQSYLRPTFW